MRAILTYHSIDASGSPISIERAAFARHVSFLRSGRVRVLPLRDLLATNDAQDAVALTFDDGFVNFASDAWPALRDAGLPALLFVPTARVGTDNRWDGRDEPGIPSLPLLGWSALGRLASEGLAIGAHSRSHAHLPRLSEAQIVDELEGSKSDLRAHLGLDAGAFCYPYGDFDERVEGLAAASFRFACTTELDALSSTPAPHRLPRLDAYYLRGPGALEAFGSLSFRARIALRRQARRLRSALRA